MEDITVKEFAEKLTELAKKYPDAKICLPDTKKGNVRYISKGIAYADKEIVCVAYNKYK